MADACLPVPHLPPVLPPGVSFPGLDLGPITLAAELCCKIQVSLPFPTPQPVIDAIILYLTATLPLGSYAAFIATVNAFDDAVNAYLDSLPLDCPLE